MDNGDQSVLQKRKKYDVKNFHMNIKIVLGEMRQKNLNAKISLDVSWKWSYGLYTSLVHLFFREG